MKLFRVNQRARRDGILHQEYARNIQGELGSILWLHKLFAVIPFNLTTYQFQVVPFILSTVLIYTIIYMVLIQLDVQKEVNSSQPYIFKFIPILLSHGQVFFSALLLLISHYKSIRLNTKLRAIVLKMIKIDRIMTEQLGIHLNHTYMRYKYYVYVIFNNILLNMMNLYLFHKLDVNIPLKFLILFYMPNIYDKLYKMLFLVLTDMLRQRLQYLNSYLKNDLTADKMIFVLEQDADNEADQYEGLQYLEKLHRIKLTSPQLRSILLVHNYICQVGQMVNKAYGLQLLVSFIITFIVLISMLFYLPVGILAHLKGKNNLFFSFAHLYWFILKIAVCTWLAKVVTECQNEVLYTSKLGYELMIEDKIPSLTTQNLADNGQEVVRVFACTTALNYNMTKTRYQLMFKPFADALLGLRADTGDLKESFQSVRGVVEPIRRELQEEGEAKYAKEPNDYLEELERARQKNPDARPEAMATQESADDIEHRYNQKLEYRCQGMVDRAKKKCTNTFSKLYSSCVEKLHWSVNWALCWPCKLTFICNFASSFGDACQPGKYLPPGYGQGFTSLNDTQNHMRNQFKDVHMQYKVNSFFKVPKSMRDTFDTSSELLIQFTEKKNTVDFILWMLVKIMLAFSFMRVIWKAEEYQRRYLTDIEFDNVYVTDYFRRIDARRRAQLKQTVLPLKKMEKKKFVDPYSFKIQWATVATPTIKLFLEIVPATFFIFVDRLFYEMLDLIRRHSHIEYTQVGHHDLSFKVKGTGMIASLVRSVITGFNVKKRIKVESSNLQCLPQPTVTPTSSIYKIYITFLCVFFMVLFNGYLRRLRRVCCALFFRKHEKRRILYLYNESLRQRRAFFKFKKARVSRLVKENRLTEDTNILVILRLRFPRYFRWLVVFPVAGRKCLICQEPEKRYWPKIACEDCPYVFCEECWDMIDHSCYLCKPLPDDEENQSDDGFDWNKEE